MTRGLKLVGVMGAALLVVALVAAACGSDKDEDEEKSSAAGTSAPAAASRTLSDCDYAKQLSASIDRFTKSASSVPSATASKDDVAKTFGSIETELGQLVAELKSYKLSPEVAKVNNGIVTAFEEFKKQVPELKSATEAGNVPKVTEIGAKMQTDFGARLDKVQTDNKDAVAKLDKCNS